MLTPSQHFETRDLIGSGAAEHQFEQIEAGSGRGASIGLSKLFASPLQGAHVKLTGFQFQLVC
jgi:hypothetical protein